MDHSIKEELWKQLSKDAKTIPVKMKPSLTKLIEVEVAGYKATISDWVEYVCVKELRRKKGIA